MARIKEGSLINGGSETKLRNINSECKEVKKEILFVSLLLSLTFDSELLDSFFF